MEGIRTPEECEFMWSNVLGFHINKEVFSEEEDNRLIDLAEEFKERNWDIIAAQLQVYHIYRIDKCLHCFLLLNSSLK